MDTPLTLLMIIVFLTRVFYQKLVLPVPSTKILMVKKLYHQQFLVVKTVSIKTFAVWFIISV
jgi:hypothetical protein